MKIVTIMSLNDELSSTMSWSDCLLTDKKIKRMGITDIFLRIWLFSANKIKKTLLIC